MSGTSLDSVIGALVTLFRSAGVQGLTVTDGPAQEPGLLALEVGWAAQDEPAATAQRTTVTRGIGQTGEQLDIRCLLSSFDGNADVATARESLASTFDALDALLKTNHTLSGATMFALVTQFDYTPQHMSSDALASMSFVVTCQSVT